MKRRGVKAEKLQCGSKVNYVKIFVVEYVSRQIQRSSLFCFTEPILKISFLDLFTAELTFRYRERLKFRG